MKLAAGRELNVRLAASKSEVAGPSTTSWCEPGAIDEELSVGRVTGLD
jgi:hypothetical protein